MGTECVVLLHGLGRTHRSMHKLEVSLLRQGYCVWNKSYASTKQTIEDASLAHIGCGLDFCLRSGVGKVHFVTHSLGGILLRYYLQHNNISYLGNIVMLSPPNKGSEIVDFFRHNYLYRWLTGPAGQQLGTDMKSVPNQLNGFATPLGIITGKRSSDPWFSTIMPKPYDGKVSVESAKLKGMTDFLVVDCGHTFIMNDPWVIKQVQNFLRFKCFYLH